MEVIKTGDPNTVEIPQDSAELPPLAGVRAARRDGNSGYAQADGIGYSRLKSKACGENANGPLSAVFRPTRRHRECLRHCSSTDLKCWMGQGPTGVDQAVFRHILTAYEYAPRPR